MNHFQTYNQGNYNQGISDLPCFFTFSYSLSFLFILISFVHPKIQKLTCLLSQLNSHLTLIPLVQTSFPSYSSRLIYSVIFPYFCPSFHIFYIFQIPPPNNFFRYLILSLLFPFFHISITLNIITSLSNLSLFQKYCSFFLSFWSLPSLLYKFFLFLLFLPLFFFLQNFTSASFSCY